MIDSFGHEVIPRRIPVETRTLAAPSTLKETCNFHQMLLLKT